MIDLGKQAGARLKLAREARGLSIRALAQETSIGHTDISRVERGRGTTLARYATLAESLGMTITDLFVASHQRKGAPRDPRRQRPVKGRAA